MWTSTWITLCTGTSINKIDYRKCSSHHLSGNDAACCLYHWTAYTYCYQTCWLSVPFFFQVSYSHFRWIYRRYHTILVIYQTIDLLYFVSSQQQLYYRNIRLSCGPTVIWSIGIYHAIFSFYANDFSQLISNNMKSAQAILSLITLLESGIDWGKWYYAIIFFTHRL